VDDEVAVLIAQRVRWWRLERGMTQRVLADLAGLDRSYITKIENQTSRLDSRSTVDALAEALGVSYADLTGQPLRPDTPSAQVAHARVHRLRGALLSSSLDAGADVPVRPLPDLAAVVDRCSAAWQECDYAAAGDGLDAAITGLHAAYVDPEATDSDRSAAGYQLVLALDVACWTARVLGYYDLAYALSARQVEVALTQGHAPHVLGLARFTQSLTISATGTGADQVRRAALRIAEQAIDELRPQGDAGPRFQVLGMLHLAALRTEVAAGGDGATHLAEARSLAERTGEGDYARLYFGPTNVAIWEVHAAVERREGGRCAEIAQRVDLTRIPSRARRTMFWRHLGLGLAQDRAGQDRAVQALLSAEREAPGKLRLDPLAREAVGHMLSRARARAGGPHLLRLARHAGVL
jgi:transcriptional regulator with XRE-family HTH domain